MYGGSVVLGVMLTIVFYRLRRPKPPQTSFYQPVRIKNVRLQFSGLMAGEGQVGFMRAGIHQSGLSQCVRGGEPGSHQGEARRGGESLGAHNAQTSSFAAIAALTAARDSRFNAPHLPGGERAWMRKN